MKTKTLALCFSLAIFSACSTFESSKTASTLESQNEFQSEFQRDPAGLIDLCRNAIANFFSEGPNTSIGTKVAADADRAYVQKHHDNQTFTVGRGLTQYEMVFHRPAYKQLNLADVLAKISKDPKAHWLDAGGGEGFATAYVVKEEGSKLKATVVSVETNAEEIFDTQTGELRRKILKGKFIEDIHDDEIPKSDLITDMYGPMAYSSSPDVVLTKYLTNLKKEGVAFVYLGEELDMFGQFSKVITKDGKVLSLSDWMKTIPGANVDIVSYHSLIADSTVIKNDRGRVAKITLGSSGEFKVPSLERISFVGGKPSDGFVVPRMIFKETDFVGPTDYPQNLKMDNSIKRVLQDFRGGELEHNFLSEVEKLKGGRWAHFSNGPINFSEASELTAKGSNYFEMSTGRMISRLKSLGDKKVKPSSSDLFELDGKKSYKLITDHNGSFMSHGSLDVTLKKYIDSLSDDGTIILNLGPELGGLGTARLISSTGGYVNFRRWIQSVPGLSVSLRKNTEKVEVKKERLAVSPATISIDQDGAREAFIDTEVVYNESIVIKIKNRKAVRIPEMDYLGKQKSTTNTFEVPFYMLRD